MRDRGGVAGTCPSPSEPCATVAPVLCSVPTGVGVYELGPAASVLTVSSIPYDKRLPRHANFAGRIGECGERSHTKDHFSSLNGIMVMICPRPGEGRVLIESGRR